jgi:sulfur-carrier protein
MKIRYYSDLRRTTGQDEIQWTKPEVTVGGLLVDLADRYDSRFRSQVFDHGQLSSTLVVLVNGRNVHHLGGIDAPIHQNDTVSLLSLVSGA